MYLYIIIITLKIKVMKNLEVYTKVLIQAAKEQGFTTAEQIEENFEALFIYVLALEERFLNKMLIEANNKETMNLISLRAFKKLRPC